jgi:Flp pilus assembly protein TadD
LITLALVQQQTGAAREALATLKQAADLQPENYKVHYHLGLMHLNLGQNREAAAAFRRALALNPYDDESQTQLGVAEQR